MISYLGFEAIEASQSAERPVGSPETIPPVGDEVPLESINANPTRYLDRPFVMAGWLAMGSDFRVPFEGAQKTYHSFTLRLVGLDGRRGSEAASIHVPRYVGSLLAPQQNNPARRQQGIAVRVRCVIQSAAVNPHIEEYIRRLAANGVSPKSETVQR